jgi:hypothetical protein
MKKFVLIHTLGFAAMFLATSAHAGSCETKFSDPALNHACQAGQEAKIQGDPTTCTKMSIVGGREDKAVYNACYYGYEHADRAAKSKESSRHAKPNERGAADSHPDAEHSKSERAE